MDDVSASASLYSGQFSQLSAQINAITLAAEARFLEDSTSRILDAASQLAQANLHSATVADVLDIPFSVDTAMRDINSARVRLAGAFAGLASVPDGAVLPPQLAPEVKAALNNGWAEAYAVAGEADGLPTFAAELQKVSQNLREAPDVLGGLGAKVAGGIGEVVDKILGALTSKLWPWLLIAGIVFFVVEFGPELRLFVAGVIKVKTPGGG